MNQTAVNGTPAGFSGGGRLGVVDAVGMGWRLMMGDFWALWLLGLVFLALMMAAGFVPYGQIVAAPPLTAGFFCALCRRIDAGRCEVIQIFEGFKQRFGQSILAMLPVMLAWLALGIILTPFIVAAFLGGAAAGAASDSEEVFGITLAVVLGLGYLLFIVLLLVSVVLAWFFVFAALAVWDHPESGWEAAKASVRLVWRNRWSVVGLQLLFVVIGSAATMIGYMTCCVGFLFVIPAMIVWQHAAYVYLYRSWTGQALVQPRRAGGGPTAEGGPVRRSLGEGGPIPPTDIQPPAGL